MKTQFKFTVLMIVIGGLDWLAFKGLGWTWTNCITHDIPPFKWAMCLLCGLSLVSIMLFLTGMFLFLLEDYVGNWVSIARGEKPSATMDF